jgi:hypothetical protein
MSPSTGEFQHNAITQRGNRGHIRFRMNHRVLDTGRFYREVAEPWQETRLFGGFRNRKKYAYIELPRGHDKTGAAAWDALYSLLAHGPGQRIYAFAGDRDQARLFW